MTVLDDLLPIWDARRVERRKIDAPPDVVLRATLTVDFLDALRQNIVVRVLFAIRSMAERVVAFARRRKLEELPTPPALRIIDMPTTGDWIRLGRTPTEIAFGVAGRFWSGETKWTTINAAEFAAFTSPGHARIGCNLRVEPTADGQTILAYEARTRATDEKSRKAFLRYWRVVSPFVGMVMRSLLEVIASSSRNSVRERQILTT